MGLSFAEAFLFTYALETFILFLVFRKSNLTMLITRNSLIANISTHPIVWFIFPVLGLAYPIQIALSEIFAVLVEALIYFRVFSGISLRYAFLLSLLCNATSFMLGYLFF